MLTSRHRSAPSHQRHGRGSDGAQAMALQKRKSGGRRPLSRKSRAPSDKSQPVKHVTAPVQVTIDRVITPEMHTAEPLWATFCGTCSGLWNGHFAAFSPATGVPEAVTLDSKGAEVKQLQSHCVEERELTDDLGDCLQRKSMQFASQQAASCLASATPDNLESLGCDLEGTGEASSSSSPGGAQSTWETATASRDDEGFIVYDGGNYSWSPTSLLHAPTLQEEQRAMGNGSTMNPGSREKPAQPAPKVSSIELALTWASDQRLRLQLLVSCSGGKDLDVDVLRVGLIREHWDGISGSSRQEVEVTGSSTAPARPLLECPSLRPENLAGSWKVFDLAAQPFIETDPLTGQKQRSLVHKAKETLQDWKPQLEDPSEDGEAFWLPGGSLLELTMQAPESCVGDSQAHSRGLRVTFSWLVKPQTLTGISTFFDGQGELVEVRSRTAVEGGWAGGRM